jgi:hypothetical protein
VSVTWTAPGDDGRTGTATGYDLRVLDAPIDNTNWDAATIVPGTPAPRTSGVRQRTVVRGLTRGTSYWFAIKSVDDAGNWSDISNIVRWDWIYDTAPPAAPHGVAAAKQGDSDVHVIWTANTEADLAGYYVYRASSASGPFVQVNGSLVTTAEFTDQDVPAGVDAVWYQITARDASNNESARSSAATVSLTETVASATTWTMETGYPNPSKPGDIVRIPLVVPGSGGSAIVEITTSTGARVRTIELGSVSGGPVTVQWDGRNEAGRAVAPGPYTAWLISGSTRMSVRLVRLP